MSRTVSFVLIALVLLVGGGWVLVRFMQPAPVPRAEVAPVAPAPRPAPPAPPPAVTEAPQPAPTPRASVAPRPVPVAPAPVETAPALGTLRIDSDVPGAQVFLDRQFVGVTPVVAENVAPGTHRVNLSAQGFDGLAEDVDVEPGPRDLMFRFKEVRLDLSIEVVHKHRFGSCTGRLVATPQGARYETTNKDDAFAVPLTRLEEFEVDYMAKELRVKALKGRRYEFTDPEGNADRLFVFHRDVDAARKRLGQGQ
jgi:hypothetical protein